MKRHVEEQIELDQLNPQKRRNVEDNPVFRNFWKTCAEKSQAVKKHKGIAPLISEYTEWTWEIRKTFDEFHAFLKGVPVSTALRHWVEGIITKPGIGEKAVEDLTKLLQFDVLPLSTEKGQDLTLGDIHITGHSHIIENIRCVPAWTQAEKDSLVACYVRFSCDLANYTFNYVLSGFDPDRKQTALKAVSYEDFYSFIPFLSARDALIAKLLYFGTPSIDDVFALNAKAIDLKKKEVRFIGGSIFLPKHLVQELIAHSKANPNAKGLVFSNVRGDQVERAHLNQSFARASERMPKGIKITPGSLLKFSAGSS